MAQDKEGRWTCNGCKLVFKSFQLDGHHAGPDANRKCPRCKAAVSTMTDGGAAKDLHN